MKPLIEKNVDGKCYHHGTTLLARFFNSFKFSVYISGPFLLLFITQFSEISTYNTSFLMNQCSVVLNQKMSNLALRHPIPCHIHEVLYVPKATQILSDCNRWSPNNILITIAIYVTHIRFALNKLLPYPYPYLLPLH